MGSLHRRLQLAAVSACVCGVALLAGCGGGGSGQDLAGGGNGAANAAADQPYADPVAYSVNPGDSLPSASEKAAVAHHTLALGGSNIAYTTTTGHLTASDAKGNPEASFFYVAYTADGQDPKTRPVTFFYNGGPGSPAIYLRLGSFAPTRVDTADPLGTGYPNFPLVDNQESLIDTTDLVFIDPPGTGYSEAIAPNTNASFWGVDQDAGVMRDFIQRYIAANQRSASPIYLYGESYGTPRTAVLSHLLESAGVHLSGIVLNSSILDYNDMGRNGDQYASSLPTFGAVAAYYNKVAPAPASTPNYMAAMRGIVLQQYASFTDDSNYNYGDTPSATQAQSFATLAGLSGLSSDALKLYFGTAVATNSNSYGDQLKPGFLIGSYDGRVSALKGSAMANGGDPSNALVDSFFNIQSQQVLPNYLKYSAPNTSYSSGRPPGWTWDFSHGGKAYPDTIPDLAQELALNPKIKILSINGYHDFVTPFFATEKDLGRLKTLPSLQSNPPNIQLTHYNGGHMTYLDNDSRPLIKADLASFYKGTPISGAMGFADLPDPWPDNTTPAAASRLKAVTLR